MTVNSFSCVPVGPLALLAAAMDRERSIAEGATRLVSILFHTDRLPMEQRQEVLSLFARMQGLRRCSLLLCPRVTAEELVEMPGI